MKRTVFLVSSASGVGKTTLCKMMRKKYPDLKVSISVTTREPREGEIDGKDYFFVNEKTFGSMVKQGKFVENAKVYGHHYGTLFTEIEKIFSANQVALFEIDWQGARQVRENFKDVCMNTIYVLPPSVESVLERLKNRQTDSRNTIDERMRLFFDDIMHAHEYDYSVVNDDIDTAFKQICTIYEATLLKSETQYKIPELVSRLLQSKKI